MRQGVVDLAELQAGQAQELLRQVEVVVEVEDAAELAGGVRVSVGGHQRHAQ